jgi:hypothetical protein
VSRLRELGFESYEAYLRSAHWASVKKQFRESNRSQNCCVCGSGTKIHIHHRTYHALGAEELDHLIAICEEHHNELHRRLRGSGRSLWDAHETLFGGKVVKQRKKKKRLAVRAAVVVGRAGHRLAARQGRHSQAEAAFTARRRAKARSRVAKK